MMMFENLIPVSTWDEPNLAVYTKLTEAQLFHYQPQHPGLFIAESPKVIERAIRAGYEPVSMLVEASVLDRDLSELATEIQANATGTTVDWAKLPIYVAPTELLQSLKGYNLLRGALAVFRRQERLTVADFIQGLPSEHPRLAVLEHVVNPANVGAIFRSAAALGIDGVLITSDSSDPLYRRSSRASMGGVFQVPWTYVDAETWEANGIAMLHDLGYQTAALALRHDTISIGDPQLGQVDRLAIILGSEGPGLRATTIEQSDYTIKIPMQVGVDSLNVAAASAVAFWELGKRP
ncbi:tRNA rRNA methyltransferase (SpoU) [Limosilactobacillus equigenerosi DSM 18793 = JCM 14505]|uniref:tRNA rRNA methyltransferase (SpoU) n=2 Tax=Limosilactobacillus TaxID=2742598 RepID=A0A0R1UN36_9LACO|nr:tRNA rRNA methyltransferase (SpoU) [Limosilactobacillus equigenerosi DSM 18793 = JCM 14505]